MWWRWFPSKVPILQTWFTNRFNCYVNSCWMISPPIWFKGWPCSYVCSSYQKTPNPWKWSLSLATWEHCLFSLRAVFSNAVFPPGFFYILRLRSRIAAAPTNCPICSSINQRPLRSKLPGKTELCHKLTDHHWVNFLPFLHLRSKLPRKKTELCRKSSLGHLYHFCQKQLTDHHWVNFSTAGEEKYK